MIKLKVLKIGLKIIKKNNKKLTEYYLEEKKLKKLKFFQLDGTKKPNIIHKEIEKIIDSKN